MYYFGNNFSYGTETKREVWLLRTGFGTAPVNKLVSLTWLLWALRSFRSFTLHYITHMQILLLDFFLSPEFSFFNRRASYLVVSWLPSLFLPSSKRRPLTSAVIIIFMQFSSSLSGHYYCETQWRF